MRAQSDRGAAAVEFAFVFVMLSFLLFALIEGGILFLHQASVSASAREGARMLAVTKDPAEAEAKATDAAQDAYLFDDPLGVSISAVCADPPNRETVVTVTTTATPTFSLGIFGKPTLTGEGAMRCGG